jgi:hypothetical protein
MPVAALYDEISADYASAVIAAIRANLKPQPRWSAGSEYLIRVVGGPQPLVDSPEVTWRWPVLVNAEEVIEGLAAATARVAPRRGRPPRPEFRIRMRILSTGRVDPGSVLLLDAAQVQPVEEAILRVVREMRFRPAEVDGIRATVWVQFPVTVP